MPACCVSFACGLFFGQFSASACFTQVLFHANVPIQHMEFHFQPKVVQHSFLPSNMSSEMPKALRCMQD